MPTDKLSAGPKPKYAVKSIKRIEGMAGSFDIQIQTPEGTVHETPTSRREIEKKVDAYAGRPEPILRRAFEMYSAVLAAFPGRDASMEELVRFAKAVGYQLPETAFDASRAWEAIFGESHIVEADAG